MLLLLCAGFEEHASRIGLVVATGELVGILLRVRSGWGMRAVEDLSVFRERFLVKDGDFLGSVGRVHFDDREFEAGSASPKPEPGGLRVAGIVLTGSGSGIER